MPVVAGPVRLIALPVHTGELLPGAGVAGVAFTTTVVVPKAEVHPFSVIVTLYVPAFASVEEAMVGSCTDDVNELGPVHVYVPLVAVEVRLIALPVHTGEFDPAVGADGVVLITTFTVPIAEVHPLVVTVRL